MLRKVHGFLYKCSFGNYAKMSCFNDLILYFFFIIQSNLGLELESVLHALRDLLEWVRIKEEQLSSQQPMTEQTQVLNNQVSLQKVNNNNNKQLGAGSQRHQDLKYLFQDMSLELSLDGLFCVLRLSSMSSIDEGHSLS